ncbi:hepatocellular carcinoma-associated antigen 59 domain-containing protein [Sarocladium implicatum]|nr:hepatocellular carcinoma-associated antigen 59 domain-containing protein [Sarocladium implicatum]
MSSQSPDPNDPTPAPQEPTIRFRPGKKRKVYRQRDESSPPPQTTTSVTSPPPNRDVDKGVDQEDDDASSAALKLRNARKHRAGGVGFGSRESDAARPSNSTTALVPSSQDGSDAVAYGMNRFTHQTGLVSSLHDKHMTEYIESRLSRRSEPNRDELQKPQSDNDDSSRSSQAATAAAARGAIDPSVEQPTRQGRLMEVDLSEVPARRTNRQQQGEQSAISIAPAPKKQRLGPDGKPWRGRKRRASDDVKRDQLVEAFLHENRLDVYDTTDPSIAQSSSGDAATGADDGTTADDRLAEQFQRQYMDDMARRRQQQRKKPAQGATGSAVGAGGAAGEDVLKGPKLGGSRNARAAVRDALLKKEKEGKK